MCMCPETREGQRWANTENSYNLKEQKIGKLLVKVMKIDRKSEDGSALIHWKNPRSWQKNAGDFALRCYGMHYLLSPMIRI